MKITFIILLFSLMSFTTDGITADSVHEFKATDIDGNETSLSKYKGKVLLIVNTASECGYTPQYEELQSLYEEYKDEGLVILGFPANNFGGQEPGTDEEIKQFCKVNFNVSFPMFSKVSVKGDDQHPLFDYLTSASNPDFSGEIKWNFEKFLIDSNGNLIHRYRSETAPESNSIKKAIESALNS